MIKTLLLIAASFLVEKKDSVGVETINGKVYIIHRVEEKETLFAISRRYGVPIDGIVDQNPTVSSGLEIGQLIKVPYIPKPKLQGVVHKVAPKETLFAISKQYGVTIDDIRRWNNMSDNTLSEGQEIIVKREEKQPVVQRNAGPELPKGPRGKIHIVGEKETMYSIARQYGLTVDEMKTLNNLESNDLKIGQELIVAKSAPAIQLQKENPKTEVPKPASTETVVQTRNESARPNINPEPEKVVAKAEPKEQTIKISESVRNGDEILEAGIAELIEGTDGNRKYLALHRTAPVGTILKVKNEMNNREVFVRVIGTLPDTAPTDKVIIRISRSAYDRLGAIDPRFRVEVTYYK